MQNRDSIERKTIRYILITLLLLCFLFESVRERKVRAEDISQPVCKIEPDTLISQSDVTVSYIADEINDNVSYNAYRKVIKTDAFGTEISVREEEMISLEKNEDGTWQYQETFCVETDGQGEGRYMVLFYLQNEAGERIDATPVTFILDVTAPEISDAVYVGEDGFISEKYGTIYGNRAIRVEFTMMDLLAGIDEQNVYVTIGQAGDEKLNHQVTGEQKTENVEEEQQETDTEEQEIVKYSVHKDVDDKYYVSIPTDIALTEFSGTITIWAADLSGNEACKSSKKIVYNTLKPEISMTCERDCSGWTNQDITFDTLVSDTVSGLKEVVYKVNGEVVEKIEFTEVVYTYSNQVTASQSASKVTGYAVVVEVTNNCGTTHKVKQQVYIDKEAPKVILSGVDKGAHYNKNVVIRTEVKDVSYKDTKTVYYITRTLDENTDKVPVEVFCSSDYKDSCERILTKQGAYQIYAVTTDGAGNTTKSDTLSFVLDKTAPKVNISGIEEDAMSGEPVTLQFVCEESFYVSNHVEIAVGRTLDGETTTIDMTEFPQNAKKAIMTKKFENDGTYRVTISAMDRAGNVSQKKMVTFSIDRTKPEIRIVGTDNYRQWAEPVTLQFLVKESFYTGNKVSIIGTRRDIDGNVEKIKLPQMTNTEKRSSVSCAFSEDGIYDIEVAAKDEAGNHENKTIHFVVDQTKPEINHVATCEGKYYQSFRLTTSLNRIFRDLTITSHQILLNGVEYNGTDVIETEGKYNLYVAAEDELGNCNSKNVEFIIDHTAPEIVFSGVGNGEIVHEKGTVALALTNTDDIITGVRMNGADCGADTRTIQYTDYGTYQIEVDCEDMAGNAVTRKLSFIYESPVSQKSGLWMLVPVIVGMCALFSITICIKRGRSNDKSSSI